MHVLVITASAVEQMNPVRSVGHRVRLQGSNVLWGTAKQESLDVEHDYARGGR